MSQTLPAATPPPVPTSGRLTIAHLRPKAAQATDTPQVAPRAVPPPRPASPRPPLARHSAPAPLPLKGERPKAIPVRVAAPTPAARSAARPPAEPSAEPPARPKGKTKAKVHPPRSTNPFLRTKNPIHAFHALAQARWPEAFPAVPPDPDALVVRPLALGAGEAVRAALAGEMADEDVARCLRAWTSMRPYLRALAAAEGQPRIRLDGSASDARRDVVTPAQAARAREQDEATAAKEGRMGISAVRHQRFQAWLEKKAAKAATADPAAEPTAPAP